MSEPPPAGACPWCGLAVDAGWERAPLVARQRCPCGAVAFGAGSARQVIDAMAAHFGISPSAIHGDIYAQTAWLRDFSIELREGGPGAPGSGVERWQWFKRSLPWERPAGPMTDAERLEWLVAQGEKFYDLMYESRQPRAEFRQAKEAFEDAIALAKELGLDARADELTARFAHVRQVFRSQFDVP